jgi:hypothetical protein
MLSQSDKHRNLLRKRWMRVVDASHEEPDRASEHEHHAGDAGIPDHDDPGRDRLPVHLPMRQ